MKFRVQAESDGGFSVVWTSGGSVDATLGIIEGFSTPLAAQEFIQGLIVKMALAFKPPTVTNG